MPAVRTEIQLSTGTWVDITDRLRSGSRATIQRGRSDRSAQADPGKCTLTINNKDGAFTPDNPMSPYYQQIGRNTPLRLAAQGPAPYLWVPDISAAGARVASTSALNVTGDIDIRVDLALDRLPAQSPAGSTTAQWTAAPQEILGRYNTAGDARMWVLMINERGAPRLRWSPDGTFASYLEITATKAPRVVSGCRMAVRATLDVNNGSSGHTVTFYTADSNAGPWEQLGETVTGTGTTSIYTSGSADLMLGDISSGLNYARGAGAYYAAEVRNGIGGTPIASVDFTGQDVGDTSVTDDAGRTWLIEGGAEITDFYRRFFGYVESWPSEWGVGGRDVYVSLTAWGPLKPMRGTKALHSTLRRRIPSFDPVAYWPMEEDSGTQRNRRASSPIDGVTFMPTEALDWAADDSLAGSAALPKIAEGASFTGSVPRPATSQTEWHVECVYYMPTAPSSHRSLIWIYGSGTVRLWKIQYTGPDATPSVLITGTDSSETEIVSQGVSLGADVIDEWLRLQFHATQDGSNVDWGIEWIHIGEGSGSFSGTYAGSVGRVTAVASPPEYHADMAGVSLGHVCVFSPADLEALNYADHGFTEEAAGDRMQRLAVEEQLPLSVLGLDSETQALGPQPIAGKLEIVEDAVGADGGVLCELRTSRGLHYLPQRLRQSRPVSVVLSYGRLRELKPTADDQGITNDVEISRPEGTSAQAVLATGRMSVQEPPAGIGLDYDTSTEVNVAGDGQLEPIAWWELHHGTWEGQRYPTVGILLHKLTADERQEVLDRLDLQARMQIPDLPEWQPPGPADVIVEGYEETIGPRTWEITCNATPAGPWTVAQVARPAPEADDPPHKVGTAGSELAAGITATQTTISVTTTSGGIWTTAAAEMPISIAVGGEHMTVTAISGASSPQTMTVTRSVNGVTKAHATAAALSLAVPAIVAL